MIKFNKPVVAVEESPFVENSIIHFDKSIIDSTKITNSNINSPILQPKTIFGTNNPNLDLVISYIQKNYADIYSTNERLLRSMVKQLIPCELSIIISWGDVALVEQKDILKVATTRMSEFAALNGNELLTEILNTSKKASQGGLLQRLSHTLGNKSTDYYTNRITALGVHLKGLATPIFEYCKTIKTNTLPIWLIAISAVNETIKIDDPTTEEAMFNRRRILQQATQNLQIAATQLEQTRQLIVKMQGEIDYIMNVVLPSLDLEKS